MTTTPDTRTPPSAGLQIDPQAVADALVKLDRFLAFADRVEDRFRELGSKVARLRDE